jgi:hypothetical protein
VPDKLTDSEWKILLRRIKAGKCTPFLGAGACYGYILGGKEIAQELAKEYEYPRSDCEDLEKVAQFIAVKTDGVTPKEVVLEKYINNKPLPNFKECDEPHSVLAALPLSVYITTNYDNFMQKALESHEKHPKRELCKWNSQLKADHKSIFETIPEYKPEPAKPLVFHLHGHNELADSLVLTEDDYIDYLVNLFKEDPLPHTIQRAITGSSLLFIGYKLADITFKIIYRGLVHATEKSMRRVSITVQLDEEASPAEQKYLENYFYKDDIRVCWGSARDFCGELRERWEKFSRDG